MFGFVVKVFTSAIMVAIIAEISKRSVLAAAVLASLHVTTVLALIWIYHDSGDAMRVAEVSYKTFWLIIPSLLFFVLLPLLLKNGLEFWSALFAAMGVTIAGFFAFSAIVKNFGVELL